MKRISNFIFIIIFFSYIVSPNLWSRSNNNSPVAVSVNSNSLSLDFNPLNRKLSPIIRVSGGYTNVAYHHPDYSDGSKLIEIALSVATAVHQPFFNRDTISKNFSNNNEIYSQEEINIINNALSDFSLYGINIDVNNLGFENAIDRAEDISTLISFGFIDLEGSGYKFSEHSGINFLTGNNYRWTSFAGWVNNTDIPAMSEPGKITDFEGGIRFGNIYQSEIQFNVYNGATILIKGSQNVIFPRTLFWKWAGSELVAGVAGLLVNQFTKEIKNYNPYSYPIIDFVLKTALNYGITSLQKNNMNFPFNSAKPLVINNISLGLQIEF
jgi:hypothetical protein